MEEDIRILGETALEKCIEIVLNKTELTAEDLRALDVISAIAYNCKRHLHFNLKDTNKPLKGIIDKGELFGTIAFSRCNDILTKEGVPTAEELERAAQLTKSGLWINGD
ncbi:MAG: hypothetical protein LUC92_03790 [Clostridiales bacterium]|nr:hypothetical protein [Clostridiales bacterium]